MSPPGETKVEVDMVPMIDIITLLLMFLVMVGDMAASASNIQMKLPRADAAIADPYTPGRITIQMQNQNGVYYAVIGNQCYDLVIGGLHKPMIDHLDTTANYGIAKGWWKRDSLGRLDMPVKLRIPEDAPMRDVERLVMTVARVGIVNIHYAAQPVPKAR